MARAPSLGSGLSPFGGGGVNFNAFNVVDPGNEAYLTFLKVENAWSNGQATDTQYLDAMKVYAAAQPAGSSNQLSIQQRIVDTTYSVNRNVLVSQVEAGTKAPEDLVAFDQAALVGLDHASQDFRTKQGTLWNSQQSAFSKAEQVIANTYATGQITSATYQQWYREQLGHYSDNPSLSDAITKQIGALDQRILDERDAKTVTDYNAGKISNAQFILYAQAARSRYADGTTQAKDWDSKLDQARTVAIETPLLYRYGLSQQYLQLEQFVKSNAGRPAGGTSTSHSSRIVLGADGKWHTITATSTHSTAPSAAAVAAYAKLQIQLADAKKQMGEIVNKLGTTPGGGGFVQTSAMLSYYTQRQGSLVPGSSDWYAIQSKIDSLNQQQHQETVLAKEGIKITYPPIGSPAPTTPAARPGAPASGSTAPTSGAPSTARSSITIDSFMSAIARVESGGRYDAKNPSGAYGKYQIMPANWAAWATQAGLSASAPQTPENQEIVAKAHMERLYKIYGNWQSVAYVWNTGAKPPANGTFNGYTAKVMGNLGISYSAPSSPSPSGLGGGSVSTAAPKAGATTASPVQGKIGGLSTVISIGPQTRTGSGTIGLQAAGFPVNLEGTAFEKFYAGYESAFKSGQESFSYGGATYFVGLDTSDRINRMRQLDDLSVQYFTTKRDTLAANGLSTTTASAQLAAAVKDSVAHEYLTLDMIAAKPVLDAQGNPVKNPDGTVQTVRPRGTSLSGPAGDAVNPIAAGLRILHATETSIASEIALAQAAYDQGDVQGAVTHLQIARHLNDPIVLGSIGGFATAGQQALAAIAKATGGMTPEQALGAGAGGKLEGDLATLSNFAKEIDTVLGTGTSLETTLKGEIKTDSAGNVSYDSHGQVQLKDNFVRMADASGKVTIQRVPSGGFDNTGSTTHAPAGTVGVNVKVGNNVETVYAKWQLTQPGNGVGYIVGADGKTKYMLPGKMVEMTVNGQTVTYYNDPLNPSHWSTSQFVYQTPNGFGSSVDANGNAVYNFQSAPTGGGGPGGRGTAGGATSDGITYSLKFDPTSGTYMVVANRPGGVFQAEIKDQVVGVAGDANVAQLFQGGGLLRSTGSVTGTPSSDVATPIFGMSPDEYKAFLNAKIPAVARVAGGDPGVAFGSTTTKVAATDSNRYAGKTIQDDRGATPPKPTTTPLPTFTGIPTAPPTTPGAGVLPKLTPLPSPKPAATSLATQRAITTATKATPTTAPKLAPLPAPKPAPAPAPTTTKITTGQYTGKTITL